MHVIVNNLQNGKSGENTLCLFSRPGEGIQEQNLDKMSLDLSKGKFFT